MNVKSPNNTSKWQMGFISAFKGLRRTLLHGISPFLKAVKLIPIVKEKHRLKAGSLSCWWRWGNIL
jgi:hypothetical protein